jgi:hypothetical protein
MTKRPSLSILVGTTTKRPEQCKKLVDFLCAQIEEAKRDDVEVVWLGDNLKCSSGLKRQRLLACAIGKYLAYVDDDDWVSDDYVKEITNAIDNHQVDVITFRQKVNLDGQEAEVNFQLGYEKVEPWTGQNMTRPPYHVCVWETMLAKSAQFSDQYYGEDVFWLQQLWPKAKTSHHINKVLHHYIWSSAGTLCQPGT